MHRWRRTSFLFLMVLKLCGCEECEYSVSFGPICVANPCVLLFDFGGRPEEIKEVNESHDLLGKVFSDVSVSLVDGGDYAVNDTLVRQIKDL